MASGFQSYNQETGVSTEWVYFSIRLHFKYPTRLIEPPCSQGGRRLQAKPGNNRNSSVASHCGGGDHARQVHFMVKKGHARLVRRTRTARPLRHSQARATSPTSRGDFSKFQYLTGYKDPIQGHTFRKPSNLSQRAS